MSDSEQRGDEIAARDSKDERNEPSTGEVNAALQRILASRSFQQAERASDFLRFIVAQTLAGAGQRLKGYTIGIEVFGRPVDFDAQSDALVRVEASRLRRRLVEYYAGEGAADSVRIELPRGGYAVQYRFAWRERAVPGPAPAVAPRVERDSSAWRRFAFGLCALLVGAIGVIVWQQTALREHARALAALAALEVPQRSEWPRIVVVPFENLSADVALDAFAATLTEEVMLRLAELDLFVIASQASWYGPARTNLDAAAPGGYVLTGSVRGTGEQARITARLIEAETGEQLWTAAYDEPLTLDRLAALQQRVERDVVAITAPYGPIFEAELARARGLQHEPKLRDCHARYHEYRRRVTAGYEETLECLKHVSERQPDAAAVWSGLAMLYIDEYVSSFGRTGEPALGSARQAITKALAIDRDDFHANLALTRMQFFDGDPDFRRSIERTIALRPNGVQALAQSGLLLIISGDPVQGLALTERARERTKAPFAFYDLIYAASHLREGRYDEALAAALKADSPNWIFAQVMLAAAAAHSGDEEIAVAAAARIRELYPSFERDAVRNIQRWRFDAAFYDTLVGGLRAAGLELAETNVASWQR